MTSSEGRAVRTLAERIRFIAAQTGPWSAPLADIAHEVERMEEFVDELTSNARLDLAARHPIERAWP